MKNTVRGTSRISLIMTPFSPFSFCHQFKQMFLFSGKFFGKKDFFLGKVTFYLQNLHFTVPSSVCILNKLLN